MWLLFCNFASKPAEADFDALTPAALVIMTVALTISFAGTEQFIDLVLLLDWCVDDVVHIIVELVIGGVHKLWESEYNNCTNKTDPLVKNALV